MNADDRLFPYSGRLAEPLPDLWRRRVDRAVGYGRRTLPRCGHLLWWLRQRVGDISLDATPDEAGLDSLEVVKLLLAAESEWGVEIPDEDYDEFRSVRDVVRYLSRRGLGPNKVE